MAGLSKPEITRIVNRYIGVFGGYLSDFSYASLADFYPDYCDLTINPNEIEDSTSRWRFTEILEKASPRDQAKIIRGVVERFPVESTSGRPETRTQQLKDELLQMAERLEHGPIVQTQVLSYTTATVEAAIREAEILIDDPKSTGGVDRIHTALHGYLKEICRQKNIPFTEADSMAKLLREIGRNHPKLNNSLPWSAERQRVLISFGGTLDILNNIRNNATLAHANEGLLERPEALLFVNAARTILNYLDNALSDEVA